MFQQQLLYVLCVYQLILLRDSVVVKSYFELRFIETVMQYLYKRITHTTYD